MSFSKLNGFVTHWQLRGKAGKPVLVFSNSLGSDFRIWDDVAALLGKDYQILLADMRGHGLSDGPAGPYTISMLADDVLALVEHLKITDFAMIGLSVGGMIAQSVAVKVPERVKSLILCDTAAKIGTAEMWAARMAAISANGIESIAEPILQRWFSSGFHATRQTELAGWRNMLVRIPAEPYMAVCGAIRDADLQADAAKISAPTLCIVGSEDGSTPPDLVRETAALIAGAKFEEIAGAGHLPCLEQPEVLAGLIARHLAASKF